MTRLQSYLNFAGNAKEAFDRLRKAQSLDNSAGQAFTSEIKGQLAKVAPKAAVSFMGAKEFVKAKVALSVAESNGGGNDTTKEVRKALETEAEAQAICMQTKDFRRAYEAFAAKQKPEFKGD